MSPVEKLLAQAEKHLGTPEALAPLVAAWCEVPSPELLALIEKHDAAHPQPLWEGAYASAPAAARGRLLESWVGQKLAATATRLDAIAQWDRDPRAGRAIEQLLRAAPYTSNGSRPMWTQAFQVLAALRDPRFVALAPELEAGWKFRDAQRKWMSHALAAALKGFPAEPPALSAADAKKVAAVSAKLKPAAKPQTARDEAELLADVYARPQDDAPRLVYADWLQERGDPRGEFIALQCAAQPDEARADRLLAKHRDAWTQPLTPVLLKGSGFTRGFVSSVTIKFKHQKDAEAHGPSPAWATIDDVGWSVPGSANPGQDRWIGYVPPALNPRVMRAYEPTVAQLLDRPTPWTRLDSLTVWIFDVELQKRFAASTLFPNVKTLGLISRGQPELVAGSWLANLTELRLDGHLFTTVPKWLAAVGPTSIQTIHFGRPGAATLSLSRGADGQLSRGVVWQKGKSGGWDFVEQLPDGWLTALEDQSEVPVNPEWVKRKLRGAEGPVPVVAMPAAPPPTLQRLHALGWAGASHRLVDDRRLLTLDAGGAVRHDTLLNDVAAAAFSADGRWLLAGTYKTAELRDAATGELTTKRALPSRVRSFAFSPSGKWAVLLCEKHAQVVSVPAGTVETELKYGTYPNGPVTASVNDDGTVAVATYAHVVAIHPIGAKKPGRRLPHPDLVSHALFLGAGRLVTECRDDLVRLFDLATGTVVVERKILDLRELVASPDGKWLLATTTTSSTVLDAATLAERGALARHLGTAAFTPDGRQVAGRNQGRVVVDRVP